MPQNDYIILRDEDGKAYLAHAGLLDNARNTIRGAANSISTTAQQVANKAKGVGRGVQQNHKYILKVNENGRTRYFYKQEEVKAYYEAKKRGIKNAVEYAQNAVKDKASDVADAAKNVINKATGATTNETAEIAKKNAADASRWAKMTERVHKENVANFKQNPTEANLARAKQSGQAVTRANQNEKIARQEADRAQVRAYQHPVNKAKSAFDQAKASASNTVTNAKTNYDRMKSEFRDRAEQAKDNTSKFTREASNAVREGTKAVAQDRLNAAREAYDKTKDKAGSAKSSAQAMIDRTRTTIKDKSEDLSAKAKSTAQSARDSVKGMIDNARSSTAKAVNEAWDRIPKNSDGTVNPFDKNFQSTYNDWKAKKDKYDSSLVGRAKDAAEKATDSVKDMIDQARKAISNEPPKPVLSSPNKPLEIENIETENIIKENRVPERRITEQRIEESRIPERIESTKQTAEEQRSNDKRDAQRLSTSAELKGGEYVSLIDKYKQRYGEDYQKYLSKDEASRLQKARDNYQTAVEDANRAWDEFDKKWSKNK